MEKDKVQEAMDSIQNAQKSLNVHSFDGIADLRGMDIPDKIPEVKEEILSRESMSIVEKENRLLSMEQELKNEKLCDLTVRTDCLDEESIEKMLEQIFR